MKHLFLALALLSAAVGVVFLALSKPPKQVDVVAQKQPTGWNSNAIRSTFQGMQIREIDSAHAELIFFYELENGTDSDYRLPAGPNLAIAAQLKSDGSLKPEDSIRIDSPVLLPARDRARIALNLSRSFNWPSQMVAGQVGPVTQGRFRTLLASAVSDVQQFVLFDESARYKIELPGGWQESPSASSAAALD